jgi:hypothetical protein
MSKNETIHDINHILDRLSDQALQDLLEFLKNLEQLQPQKDESGE